MRAASAPASFKPASSVGPLSSVAADIESSAKDVVKVPTDDNVAGEYVAARSFGPETYRPEEVWFAIFQVQEVQSPLFVVSQKHRGELMDSLRAKKYKCGTRLRIVGKPACVMFDAVNFDSLLEHHGEEGFPKDSFSLAVVDGRLSFSWIQMLFSPGQPGIECDLQPNRTTLIRALQFEVSTDHELIKLSISADMLLVLDHRDRGVIAVIESLIQYSRALD